jgi:hypothetical protein
MTPARDIEVEITFLSPQEHAGKLHPGKTFLIREGNKAVGYGTVLAIFSLESSAKHAGGELPMSNISVEREPHLRR